MSSGGFYKFRCKNFYTYNCNNWVYVNNSVCATCCAEGRDGDVVPAGAAWPLARDVFVPRAEDGMLHYTEMELVAGPGGDQPNWVLRYAAKESLFPPPPPPPPPPRSSSQPQLGLGRTVATTSAIPGAPLPATTF